MYALYLPSIVNTIGNILYIILPVTIILDPYISTWKNNSKTHAITYNTFILYYTYRCTLHLTHNIVIMDNGTYTYIIVLGMNIDHTFIYKAIPVLFKT